MATVNSNVAAKQHLNNAGKLLPVDFAGRVRIAFASYAGNDAAGTVIRIVRLPKGARVLGSSRIYFAAGQGATLTVKVGDAKDDDRYLDSVAPGASACVKELNLAATAGYILEEETDIILTTGAAALTPDKKIVAEIHWVLD